MISFFVLVIVYFAFSWGLPWHKIPSTISFSYIFDLLFALSVSFFFRLPWKFRWIITKQTVKATIEVLLLSGGAVLAIWYMDIETPFRLVNNLEWHLLLFAPVLEELDAEIGEKVKIVKVDVDENQETAGKFGIMSIPTLLVLKDGEVVDKVVGFQPKEALAERLEKQF